MVLRLLSVVDIHYGLWILSFQENLPGKAYWYFRGIFEEPWKWKWQQTENFQKWTGWVNITVFTFDVYADMLVGTACCIVSLDHQWYVKSGKNQWVLKLVSITALSKSWSRSIFPDKN